MLAAFGGVMPMASLGMDDCELAKGKAPFIDGSGEIAGALEGEPTLETDKMYLLYLSDDDNLK